ncbi:Neurotransmitter-gated ion-channel ligand-binding domain [Trinorchestia longiramus]|nr:Neurotransmitter-gated ion-channel ligand-binding domain [Trinorchestia longiramus]
MTCLPTEVLGLLCLLLSGSVRGILDPQTESLPRGEHLTVLDFFLHDLNDTTLQVQLNLTDFSGSTLAMCMWFREVTPVVPADILEIDFNHRLTTVQVNKQELYIQSTIGAPLYASGIKIQKLTWTEFCITLFGSEVIILRTADDVFVLGNTSYSKTQNNDDSPLKISLGPDTTQMFFGAVAGIRIYDRELTEEEIAVLNTCNGSSKGTVPFTEESKAANGFGINNNVAKLRVKKSKICDKESPKNYIVLRQKCGNYNSMKVACENLGGRLPSRERDYIEDITDGFFYAHSENQTSLQNIYLESPNSPNQCDVIEISILSNERYVYKNETNECAADLQYLVCILNESYSLRVYTSNDNVQLLFPHTIRYKVFFSDSNNNFLTYASCRHSQDLLCLFYYTQTTDYYTYELQSDSTFFIGRKRWDSLLTSDSSGSKIFSMTVCNTSSFTCDSGSCINIMLRCNGEVDCDDSSDEGAACSYILPLPTTYWKKMCPTSKPVIKMRARSLGVNNVLMNNNEIEITLFTDLTWMDHRVNFTMLLVGSTYQLPEENLTELWRPQIFLDNGGYSNNLNIAKRTSLLENFYIRTNVTGDVFFHNTREGIVNYGSDVEIHYETSYLYTFGCRFDFFAFPFDIQVCSLKFSLKKIPGSSCQPVWSFVNAILSNHSSIPMYDVQQLRYTISNEKQLRIHVLMKRKYFSYLLTTFLPCIILSVLGSMTMISFRLDNFQDRITVTLSLLIVVASLFSQVVSTIPTSPSSKCVEIFFFYIILRLAFVFMLHSIVDVIISRGLRTVVKPISSRLNPTDKSHKSKQRDEHSGKKAMGWLADFDNEMRRAYFIPDQAQRVNKIGWIVGFTCDLMFALILSYFVLDNTSKQVNSFEAAELYPFQEEYNDF